MAKKDGKRYVILLWDGNECKARYLFAAHIKGGVPEIDTVGCFSPEERAKVPRFSHSEAHCLCAFLQSFAPSGWVYSVTVL